MSEKSFVAVEYAICPVCAEKHDVGILLDKRIKPRFPSTELTTHFELCKEHKEKLDEGFVALVGIDPSASEISSKDTLKMGDAYRIGKYALVKEIVFTQILNASIPEGRISFCEEGVLDYLESLQTSEEVSENAES